MMSFSSSSNEDRQRRTRNDETTNGASAPLRNEEEDRSSPDSDRSKPDDEPERFVAEQESVVASSSEERSSIRRSAASSCTVGDGSSECRIILAKEERTRTFKDLGDLDRTSEGGSMSSSAAAPMTIEEQGVSVKLEEEEEVSPSGLSDAAPDSRQKKGLHLVDDATPPTRTSLAATEKSLLLSMNGSLPVVVVQPSADESRRCKKMDYRRDDPTVVGAGVHQSTASAKKGGGKADKKSTKTAPSKKSAEAGAKKAKGGVAADIPEQPRPLDDVDSGGADLNDDGFVPRSHRHGEYDEDDEGLAVAFAVPDPPPLGDSMVSSGSIHHAVEYEPGSKPPIYRNRRFQLWAGLGLFLVIVAVAAGITASVVLTRANSAQAENVSPPTAAPTLARQAAGIRSVIAELIGSELLDKYNPASRPYRRALDWITFGDGLQLTPDDDHDHFIQRFSLAYLYFATTQDNPWFACNPPLLNDGAELSIASSTSAMAEGRLFPQYDTSSDNATTFCEFQMLAGVRPLKFRPVPANRWLSSSHECTWGGITCDVSESHVHNLLLQAMNMTGPFPTGIYHLPYLQLLTFSWNKLEGPLPTDIMKHTKHLVSLGLHYNRFTGTIPINWYTEAPNLRRLTLGANALVGSIPSDIEHLSDLLGFHVFNNQLTGTIPSEMARLKSLVFTRLSDNHLEGSLPTELVEIRDLRELLVDKNDLTGTIPEGIGNWSDSMLAISLGSNRLHGTLPLELYSLTHLWRFDLSHNNFTGTVSDRIGQLATSNIVELTLNDNRLTGALPSSLANLTQLSVLELQGNAFLGSVPEEICQAKEDSNFTSFATLSADCGAPDSMLPVKLQTFNSSSINNATIEGSNGNGYNSPTPLGVYCSCCSKCCYPLENGTTACAAVDSATPLF